MAKRKKKNNSKLSRPARKKLRSKSQIDCARLVCREVCSKAGELSATGPVPAKPMKKQRKRKRTNSKSKSNKKASVNKNKVNEIDTDIQEAAL